MYSYLSGFSVKDEIFKNWPAIHFLFLAREGRQAVRSHLHANMQTSGKQTHQFQVLVLDPYL